MEEVADDFEKDLVPDSPCEAPCEPPPLVREKTVKRGRPKKEAKKKEPEPPIIEVETPPSTPETPPEKTKKPVKGKVETKVEKPVKAKVDKPVKAPREKPLAPPKNLLKKQTDTPEWVDPRPHSFYEELAMARQAQALQRQNAMMAPYVAMFEQRRNAAY